MFLTCVWPGCNPVHPPVRRRGHLTVGVPCPFWATVEDDGASVRLDWLASRPAGSSIQPLIITDGRERRKQTSLGPLHTSTHVHFKPPLRPLRSISNTLPGERRGSEVEGWSGFQMVFYQLSVQGWQNPAHFFNHTLQWWSGYWLEGRDAWSVNRAVTEGPCTCPLQKQWKTNLPQTDITNRPVSLAGAEMLCMCFICSYVISLVFRY